jgi:hypothetical protein
MKWRRWAGVAGALVGAGAGCDEGFAALVHVTATTDIAETGWIELRIVSQDGGRVIGRDQRAWPAGSEQSFNLVPRGGDLAASPEAVFEVVAGGCAAEGGRIPERCVLVMRRARVAYVAGAVVELRMALEGVCRGVDCGVGMTCVGGACVSERIGDGRGGMDAGVGEVDVGIGDDDVGADVGMDVGLKCPAGHAPCGTGGCIDLVVSREHCGACGRACRAGQTCNGGVCGCPVGRNECMGSCVDLRSDGANCGTCGRACPAGQVCSAGACAMSCTGGATSCGGSCVFLAGDPANCGSCGNACERRANAAVDCRDGMCLATCDGGWGDCNGNASDGCETRLADSADHCGMCGNRCPGGRCVSMACVTGASDAGRPDTGTPDGGRIISCVLAPLTVQRCTGEDACCLVISGAGAGCGCRAPFPISSCIPCS